ncbi:Phosphoglycerate dehydrogenase [Jatrophihabitans endophyticus]|uniref:Phosphoglycerate dehydrogenase n=1 Tax=Jatrophihabitans endophyticus TaxID=1206085 RepID=A0A1M5DA91_9ACTN|nr:2-hydroxyacid dehydrogenase [Jatrophihabitans endophyticus]SHF63861.1 Phosphoglycerate dehydrogenase [Jatrophihabitans endophyticus]
MTITVSVPTDDERDLLRHGLAAAVPGDGGTGDGGPGDGAGAAPDVDIVVWDGTGTAPDGAERIELFVGRYNAPPPAREALAELPVLRVVQLVSAGVEPWLPVVPDGVALCNGRGVHGSSTAELAVAGLLSLLRELPAQLDAQRDRRWERREARGLAGRRVLVLGAGDIGRRIGGVAELLDAEVTYVARTAREGVHALAELPDLLPRQQVVVVALPLTAETERLVDAAFLAALPDGAVLVNISRGRHVDTDALVAELRAERLSAFLDVTDPEPLPAGHPLWDAPGLLLTPHLGGGTSGWEQRAYRLVAEQVRRLADGGVESLVNRVAGDY